MVRRSRRRYAGIAWEAGPDVDHSIWFVATFDNPSEAMDHVAGLCHRRDRWAVVDLNTLGIMATGHAASRTGRATTTGKSP
jgi:hypothetical protein